MSKGYYPEVQPNPDFAALEESVLGYWEQEKLFSTSVENRPAKVDGKSNEYIFYDGPPFANGLPHYGHLLTGFVKDVYARYHTMLGARVERRFGWDCHGLPAEMGSEKELGISGRNAIIHFGIENFNAHCQSSVMKYTREWEHYVTRQARWVDFEGGYKTMDKNFMESVLWAFKQIYDKGWVYEAYRVMPYSWAAETPLSNFETKLDNSYREREDKAATVAFKLKDKPKGAPEADAYYVLAWTTTPWTLPSNLALAVNTKLIYDCVLYNGACYIVADKRLGHFTQQLGLYPDEATTAKAKEQLKGKDTGPGVIVGSTFVPIPGKSLLNLSYEPLFPYFQNQPNAFRILDGSSFVTDGDGTGIVHMAPGFGEDDQKCCEANGIEVVVPVDGQGKYTDAVYDIPFMSSPSGRGLGEGPHPGPLPVGEGVLSLAGLNVIADKGISEDDKARHITEKDVEKFGLANMRILRWLKANNKLIRDEVIKHNYPHCWRTDTPLIYRAMPSWYVEVTKFRDRAVELNKQINWIPAHVRDGQMGHMLATAPDWSISRNRFWGTPIPVWRSKSGKIRVCGSIKEIEELSGEPVGDLHRPYIDAITFTIDGEEYKRVEDVFDCWFESGSMPFAQVHYPFENKEWFENHFPADFITEYMGQTRGWFNTLIMLATALFDKPPFKNCICHGVVLDAETGLKYSKRLKNYKDPLEVINQYGADALRWLMVSSPVMRGQDLMVDPQGKFIRDVVRLAIKPVWNAYNFFCLYANADGVKAKYAMDSQDVMDRYILAKCKEAVAQIKSSLDAYDTPGACDALQLFFDSLNNWYIRRNKERFWKTEHDADKQAAYDTLFTVLTTMCKAAAPLLPLTLEEIYRGLTGEASVHLADFPDMYPYDGMATEKELIEQMDRVRDICNAALSIRNATKIRVRQPLQSMTIVGGDSRWLVDSITGYTPTSGHLISIIRDEINVKILLAENEISTFATLKLSINSAVLGKRLPEKMKQILPASKKGEWKQADGTVEIAGEKLLPGEYTLQLEPKPEYKERAQALSTNDALVILDTTVTPELEAEGIARDLVRMIQQARKDAALNVSDRIRLHLDAPEPIAKAVAAHKDYVTEQTLSEMAEAKLDKPAFTAENTLDDQKITISFSLAA